jgi:hypothetical protein
VQVAARGAEDNINDDVENVNKVLLVSGIFLKSVVWAQHLYNLMCEMLL